MTRRDQTLKRAMDLTFSVAGLIVLWPVILLTAVLARWDTGASGIFRQERIGRHGRRFRLLKVRTMRPVVGTTITTCLDDRITPLGAKLRRLKLDELPQLWNVLRGDMSLVGPRPDVPGWADRLEGDARALLALRPGITGPATLRFREEEKILGAASDPERHNAEVIWPEKVRLNLAYMEEWSLRGDVNYIARTVFG